MAIIITISDDSKTHTVKFNGADIVFGRSSTADVKITDDLISGQHMMITQSQDATVIVKDLGSTNGTFINGSKINESRFFVNDEVIIGNTVMKIEVTPLNKREKEILTRDYERTNLTYIDLAKTPQVQIEKACDNYKTSQLRQNLISDINKKNAHAPKSHLKTKMEIQQKKLEKQLAKESIANKIKGFFKK
jgi:predicted component of type VI protein secretion system